MRSTALTRYFFIPLVFILCTSEFSCSKPPERTSVNISLQKTTYKTYEPIELRCELINLENKASNVPVYAFRHDAYYYITDEHGAKFRTKNIFNGLMPAAYYTVEPFDTLINSFTLNHLGIVYWKKFEEMYFKNEGFFPPGKYMAYLVYDSVKSNTVSFEVVETDEKEREILELARSERYDEALVKYPGNYFEEHLTYWSIQESAMSFLRADKGEETFRDTSGLAVKYENFFAKYPNSNYNLQESFLYFYFRVSAVDSARSTKKMYDLKDRYPATNISRGVDLIINREQQDGRSFIFKKPKNK